MHGVSIILGAHHRQHDKTQQAENSQAIGNINEGERARLDDYVVLAHPGNDWADVLPKRVFPLAGRFPTFQPERNPCPLTRERTWTLSMHRR